MGKGNTMSATPLSIGGRWRRSRVGRWTLVLLAVTLAVSVVGETTNARALDKPPGVKPSPSRLPAGHPMQESGHEVGFIQITAIDLNVTVRSGISMSVINQGPAHWAGTAMPGEAGNVVLAGHRTTRTRPFYHLNRLEPGDAIVMGDGGSFPAIYRVTETLIVDPEDIWITYNTGDPIVTLFACHPRGSARHRIVVRGALRTGLPIQ